MSLVLNSKVKDSKNQLLNVALRCIIFSIIVCGFSVLSHVLYSTYIEHAHGRPEFVRNTIFIYSFFEKILFVIGYLVLGYKIPISNTKLRGFTYAVLVWASDFMPQLMGLTGADGAIVKMAFGASVVVCDSLTYFVAGVMLGIIFKDMPNRLSRNCDRGKYIKSIITSAIGFPILVIVIDQILAQIYKPFSSASAMGVSDQQQMKFYITFYSWFILSGALLAVFYRITEYNEMNNKGWLKFAINYTIYLWSPVVLIMIVFGTEIIPTIAYSIVFAICIAVISWINSRILNG